MFPICSGKLDAAFLFYLHSSVHVDITTGRSQESRPYWINIFYNNSLHEFIFSVLLGLFVCLVYMNKIVNDSEQMSSVNRIILFI